MQNEIKAPRGTIDVLGKDSYKWQYVEKIAAEVAQNYGCKEVRFPTFEDTDLFARGVGDTTDIVQKEMYTFNDKGGRSITLRPEGTASVVRQCSEHGLLSGLLPLKAYYIISAFRYEKPQAGRFREFHQFGIEFFGPSAPVSDAEVIKLGFQFLNKLKIKSNLKINSIGCPKCRELFQKALREFFFQRKETLCGTCNTRLDRNPMRILDCKSPVCREITANAPIITDFLCDECKEHYQDVQKKLTLANIPFELDPHIVRGLDYYTKTVFEFIDSKTGQALLAGGRYDGLVKEIDGKMDVCGLGFASGLERLVATMEKDGHTFGKERKPKLFVASIGEKGALVAEEIVEDLRNKGLWAEMDLMNRSLKAQMKYADKIETEYSIVLGDTEVDNKKGILKNMKSGEQLEISFDAIYEAITAKKI